MFADFGVSSSRAKPGGFSLDALVKRRLLNSKWISNQTLKITYVF